MVDYVGCVLDEDLSGKGVRSLISLLNCSEVIEIFLGPTPLETAIILCIVERGDLVQSKYELRL